MKPAPAPLCSFSTRALILAFGLGGALLPPSAVAQQCPAPLARQDRVALPPGTEATYELVVANPLLNDSSGSGRLLSLAMSLPQGDPVTGQLSSGPDGSLLFTGTRGAVLTRYFEYEVHESGLSDSGTVRISEGLEFEAPPSIVPDYYSFPQDCTPRTLNVLANDSLPLNSVVRLVSVIYGPNSRGMVTFEGDPPTRLIYQSQPCETFTGPDEFQYVVQVNGLDYPGAVHVDINPASLPTPPFPCFLPLDPNYLLPVGAPGETQRDGVFDVTCARQFQGSPYSPSGFCWDFGDGTPLVGEYPDPECAPGTSFTVGSVCSSSNPSVCYSGRRYVHRYAQLGSYIVRQRVKNSAGTWSDWTGRPVTLSNGPPAAILAPLDCWALDCAVDASISTDDFDPPSTLSYSWDFGDDSPLVLGPTASHHYDGLGTYPLTLVVTDSQGAIDIQTRTVAIVDRVPEPHFLVAATCGDRCLSFAAATVDDFGLAGHEWRWTRVADGATGLLGVGATASLTSSALGLYDVTLASTDGAGQTGTLTQRVHLSGALLAATDWWTLPSGATEIALDPRANDGPGSGLVISSFGQGQYGAVSTGLNGTLRYQLTGPRPTATDRFAYTVTDSLGNTAMGSVRIVTRPIGEVGRAEGVTNVAAGVGFARDYGTAPLVFALPASANDPEPATARITSVKPADFSVKVQEPANGVHGPETVDYLVIAPPWVGAEGTGVGTLEDGRPFAAGRLTLGLTLGNGTGDALDRWAYVSLPRAIGTAGTPVVLAQVQSNNDPAWVSVRLDRVDATGFRIALEVPEAANGHGAETVAWVAFPASASPASDPLLSEAAATGSKFEGTFQRFSLGRRYPVPPLVVATLRSRNDGDPATLRRRLVDVSGVELSVQEDATLDAESLHGLEDVSLLAFAEPAVLAGSTRTLLASDGGGLVGRDDRFQVWASKDSLLPVLWNDQPGTGDLELLGFVQPMHGRLSRILPGSPPPLGELPLDLGLEGGLGGEIGGEFPVGGDLLYQPPTPEFRGWDAFEYTVRDGSGDRATLIVWIEVVGENEQ